MDKGDILVSAAVEGEMEGIIRNLADPVTRLWAGGQAMTRGCIGQQAVRLLVTGPGMANTVHGVAVAIAAKRPRLIIQTGCGGGFAQSGIDIGDVAIASAEIDAQLGLEQAGAGISIDTLPFPVIRRHGREIFNCYPVAKKEFNNALATLKTRFSESDTTVFAGPFITVTTITASTGRAGDLYRRHGALVENMEGSGAAPVAALHDLPFLEIRAVSNGVGERDKSKWDLPLSFERCSRAVLLYLENRLV